MLDLAPAVLAGIRGRLTADAALAPGTWFRAGGTAGLLFQPADTADLADFLARLPASVPVAAMGVGSNLLVRDGGFAGAVIRLGGKGFGDVTAEDDDRIRAGAAVPDKRLAAFALERGLAGFEFYHGIPGTVGGALRMNAGASGGETRGVLVEAEAVDRAGVRHVLDNPAMGFSYRHAEAPSDFIFVSALFRGTPAPASAIQAAMDAVQRHRETSQPVRDKTGGSTFKNPPGHRAWELIDAAGCRGLVIGGAQVSPLHCNFLINTGAASAYDLELLGETVRLRVLEATGVRLEWEIERIGAFAPGAEVEPFLGRG